MMRAVLLVLLISLPAWSADNWVLIKSPNFTVRTDAGEKRGREIALHFEQMRKIFETLIARGKLKTNAPLDVIAFRNTKGLRAVSPLWKGKPVELAGFYQKGEDRNFIALDSSAENAWRVVFHEYAHFLLNTNLPPTPAWWDEGFADYYSTIEVGKKDFKIGEPPEGYGYLLSSGLIPMQRLMTVTQETSDYNESGHARTIFYAQSWLFVHYLYDRKLLKETAKVFDLIRDKEPLESALQKGYGKSFKDLDKDLQRYFNDNKALLHTFGVPLGLDSSAYVAQPMTELDVQTIMADLHLNSRDYQQQAEAEFKQILEKNPQASEPHRALGYLAMRRGDWDGAIASFLKAAQIGSNDARVYYLAAFSRYSKDGKADDDVRRFIDKALELNPDMADAHNLKSIVLSRDGDYTGAISSLTKAVELAPRRDDYRMNLAGQYMNQRKFDEAQKILEQLVNSEQQPIAIAAREQLGSLKQWSNMSQRSMTEPVAVRLVEGNRKDDEDDAASTQPAARDARTMKFMKGTLVRSECPSDGTATIFLKVGAKMLKLHAAQAKKILMLGADAFDCGWTARRVAVNFRESAEAEGDLVSVELQ
jgi:Flp pilus assembly protein TadD